MADHDNHNQLTRGHLHFLSMDVWRLLTDRVVFHMIHIGNEHISDGNCAQAIPIRRSTLMTAPPTFFQLQLMQISSIACSRCEAYFESNDF